MGLVGHSVVQLWTLCEGGAQVKESEGRAQRTFFRTVKFDSCNSKQLGSPSAESNWYNLVGRLIEIIPSNEVREVGEVSQDSKCWRQRERTGKTSSAS